MHLFSRFKFVRRYPVVLVFGALMCVQSAGAATTVVAWGSDRYEQTVLPPGLTNVVSIAAGGDHSLALCDDGTVVSWGRNTFGQTTVPPGLSNVIEIACGGEDSLALKFDGTVVVWGSNGSGQGGIPPGLSHVAAIASGFGHHLALRKDGIVVAWGYNFDNQARVPAQLSKVRAVAGGAYHSIALRKDGTVAAWGDNTFGQTNVPAVLADVMAIASGSFHNLALRTDGTVVAWGRNDSGEASVPSELNDVVAIAAGDSYSLALRANGTVRFWGYDFFHLSEPASQLSNVVAIAAGISHCVALVNDGEPRIIHGPGSQTVYAGASASFETTVVGEPPLSYQWNLDRIELVGATNAALTLHDVQLDDAGSYGVVVSNSHGQVTASTVLTVITNVGAPYIVSQPCDVQTVRGADAVLAVEADGGNSLLHYQWHFNHTNALAGATNDLLRLTNVDTADAGIYTVAITNALGSVVSEDAELSLVTNVAWVFATGNYVFSSPAIAEDGTVYVGSANGRLYALDSNGVRKWDFPTGGEIQSSPAIGRDGTVYFGSGDGFLYALNPNGTQNWRFQTGDVILSSPTLAADGTIYINSRDGKFYAISPDGTKEWDFATGDYYNDMPAVIGPDSKIYLGVAGKVIALDKKGRTRWDAPVGGSNGNVSVVIGQRGIVHATSGGFGMKMVAFTHRGRKLWEFPFGNPTALVAPSYPAISSDGTIYIATSDSLLYAINPDGSLKWKIPATRSQSSPALGSDGKIYLNSDWDFRLLCYDTDGAFQWEHLLGGSGASGLFSSFPMLQNGVLYFGSGNGNVYAYNVSGELDGGGWPGFGRDPRHTGRDIQRAIEAAVDPVTSSEELHFVVEPDRSYRIQGSSNTVDWVDCVSFTSTNSTATFPRPPEWSFFRLVSP